MNFVIYCRKSTDTEDKQVLSIDSQERELLELAKKENLVVIKIFKETRSAKDIGRPVFAEMIDFVKKGKAQGIITWKIDRLARNLVDGGTIIDLLQRSTVQMIRTHDRTCLPSDNVLMLAVEFGMANQYIRDLSANVKRGYREKFNRGEWPHRAPLGYVHNITTKMIEPDPVKRKYILHAYELYSTGSNSLGDIADILYSEGFRTDSGDKVRLGQIQRILQNPLYTSVMVREGKFYIGKHESLISKELFDKAQHVAAGGSRPRPKERFFPLRGFMRCGTCDCLLTASLKKGHHYYYCTNGKQVCDEHKTYMRESYLYPLVASILDDLHFDEELVEIMYQAACEKARSSTSQGHEVLDTLQNTLKSLKAREEKLLDSYLDGRVPQSLYEEKMLKIGNERTILEQQIKQASQKTLGAEFTLEPIKNVFLEGSRAKKEFLDADDVKKKKILEKVLWNLSVKDKNIVDYQFKSEFAVLAKSPKKGDLATLGAVVEDVRTVFERLNDATIYIPDLQPSVILSNSVISV